MNQDIAKQPDLLGKTMFSQFEEVDSARNFHGLQFGKRFRLPGLCRLFRHLAKNSTFWQRYRDKLTCGEMFARRS